MYLCMATQCTCDGDQRDLESEGKARHRDGELEEKDMTGGKRKR